jgi:hypothetical protein
MAEWKRKKIPGHTPERERAEQLGVVLDTLRKWRRQGKGQAYVVVGREVHYVDADEPRWLASLKVTPPREALRRDCTRVRAARKASRMSADSPAVC